MEKLDWICGRCPWCLNRIQIEATPVPGRSSITTCIYCGHLAIYQFDEEMGDCIFSKMTYCYLHHQEFDLEFLKFVHEEQEKVHHEKGHWG